MPTPAIDQLIDWGSYAGKRRHLPWFLLALRLLAQHGLPVFMHGDTGESADRLYTQNALAALDMPVAQSFSEAHEHLMASHFVYLPLTAFAPGIKHLMRLRDLLERRQIKPEQLDPTHLRAVWEGERNDVYGEAAVLSTLAAVLFALGRAASHADAVALAQTWWNARYCVVTVIKHSNSSITVCLSINLSKKLGEK